MVFLGREWDSGVSRNELSSCQRRRTVIAGDAGQAASKEVYGHTGTLELMQESCLLVEQGTFCDWVAEASGSSICGFADVKSIRLISPYLRRSIRLRMLNPIVECTRRRRNNHRAAASFGRRLTQTRISEQRYMNADVGRCSGCQQDHATGPKV